MFFSFSTTLHYSRYSIIFSTLISFYTKSHSNLTHITILSYLYHFTRFSNYPTHISKILIHFINSLPISTKLQTQIILFSVSIAFLIKYSNIFEYYSFSQDSLKFFETTVIYLLWLCFTVRRCPILSYPSINLNSNLLNKSKRHSYSKKPLQFLENCQKC